MKATESKAYDGALWNAAQQAYEGGRKAFTKWENGHHGETFSPPCFYVYFDGERMYVRDGDHPVPRAELVCIAQYFSPRTVQLRFNGGHSEFFDF